MGQVITLQNKTQLVDIVFPKTNRHLFEVYYNCKFVNALSTEKEAVTYAQQLLAK